MCHRDHDDDHDGDSDDDHDGDSDDDQGMVDHPIVKSRRKAV